MVSPAQKRRLFRNLDKRDPSFIKKIEPFLDALWTHYFRCDVEGWENVELSGDDKTLFVGNHNGMITWEVVMLFYAWYKKFGLERRALGLGHNLVLENPLFSWICPKIGTIPADPDIADEAIARGFSLLVYPGGEKESFREYSKRKQVDFFQRKGFIRLALRNKIKITPIASIGAHETYVVVHQGEALAKHLGLYDKMRLHGLPINVQSVFFFWCVSVGALAVFPLLLAPAAFASIFVPLPAKMSFRVLPSIDVCSMVQESLSEEENLQRIYDHVVGTLQAAVTEGYARRKYPIIG